MNYAQLLLPDFSLILCGYLLCRFTALNRSVWTQVDALGYYFLFPTLLFHSIVKSPIHLASASYFVLAAWSLVLLGVLLAYSLVLLPRHGRYFSQREHAACAQIAFRQNTVIGLALAQRLLGDSGTQLMVLLAGVCVPLINVAAVWPMARQARLGFARELLRNPLILAAGGGLLLNLVGMRLPTWIEPSLQRIDTAALMLGLMAAGAGLQWTALARAKLLGAAVLLIRHALLPLVALLLTHVLGLAAAQSSVLLIFASLPTAASSYVLAVRMGYDGSLVAGLVTLSTLLGMLSLPFGLGLLE